MNTPTASAHDDELVRLQETLYTSKNSTRRWLHCSRRDWIINALQRCAPFNGNGKALEVGPGSGIYLPTLAKLYAQVVASDIQAAYLQHAEPMRAQYPNLSFLVDDITASQFEDASYDLILCTEVIEHIHDSVTALKEMRRILKPGGILVLSTPQRYSPLELTAKIAFLPGIIDVVKLIYREPILETGHINLLTARQVREQLSEAGFSVREAYKCGMYLPVVAEFMGGVGLCLEQWLERVLRDGPADGVLWTQFYIATH